MIVTNFLGLQLTPPRTSDTAFDRRRREQHLPPLQRTTNQGLTYRSSSLEIIIIVFYMPNAFIREIVKVSKKYTLILFNSKDISYCQLGQHSGHLLWYHHLTTFIHSPGVFINNIWPIDQTLRLHLIPSQIWASFTSTTVELSSFLNITLN